MKELCFFTDYETQSWYIRWYRWCRYMPLAMIRSVIKFSWWVIRGMKAADCNRRITARLIWRHHIADAWYDMGHTFKLRDFIDEFRAKAEGAGFHRTAAMGEIIKKEKEND